VDLHVSFAGRTNLAGQIYQQIRAAVLDGRLRPGETLPPSRELARRLTVSRNTVGLAYDRLAAEGFVTTRTGAGTYVSALLTPGSPAGDVDGAARPTSADWADSDRLHRPGGSLRARPMWTDIPLPPDLSAIPAFDFRVGVPDVRMFPYATWRRHVGEQLRASAVGNGMAGHPAGHLGLRTAIARHIGVSRAVHAAPEDVLVTTGIQQAIDLVGRVLLEPGACVAMEEPGYIPPRLLFESLGARIVGIPVDGEGLIVDALPADARVVYVTPSHQFPTGVAMSLRRRMALLAWADRHDAAVVEDDYDSEFRYAGQPLEPLQSLDRSGRVVYVGSFSKVMLPTLRLGFLVAPASLRHALQAAKFVTDWHTSLPTQAALAEFIDDGGLARHIRRMRNEYRVRHERIATELDGPLARWLEPIPSAAGLHLSAYLKDGATEDLRRLVARTKAEGIELYDLNQRPTLVPAGVLSRQWPARPVLLLGYGGIPTSRLDEGLRRLRGCLEAL
jgi:GntR family transcriptional regulator/MocR family aminotransferase